MSNKAFLQVQVAGTTITVREDRAALVLYGDDRFMFKKAFLDIKPKANLELLKALMQSETGLLNAIFSRIDNDTNYRAAIFDNIPVEEIAQDYCEIILLHFYDVPDIRLGQDDNPRLNQSTLRVTITLFAGNVTEVDLRGR